MTRTRIPTAHGSRPHVGLCMVMSLDGRTVVDSHSRQLSGPADLAMLVALRRIADVVIVGASTAIIDTYDQTVRQDLPIGVVTTTAPVVRTRCASVIAMSPVPGGRSSTR